MCLSELKIGEEAIVLEVKKDAPLKQRFLDLGIISGMKIVCVLESPFKNPKAYEIRGTTIAIRDEDAKFITIERMD